MSGLFKVFLSGACSVFGGNTARDYIITGRKDNGADNLRLLIAEIERLYKLNPDYARAFIDRTKKEADIRRKEIERENYKIIIARLSGQFVGFLFGMAGVTGGCYVAYTNPDAQYVGAIIAIVSISVLVFIGRSRDTEYS